MATTENRAVTTGEDDVAIAELQEVVERQRSAFLADPFPSLEERQALLGALAAMLMTHRTEIQEATSSDFAVHPALASDLIEVLGPAGRAVAGRARLSCRSRVGGLAPPGRGTCQRHHRQRPAWPRA